MALASFSEATGWALALVALGERDGCEGFQGDGRHGFLWLGYTRNMSGACVHLRLVIIRQVDFEAYLESWCWQDLLRDASLCDSGKPLMAGNQFFRILPPNLAILVLWTFASCWRLQFFMLRSSVSEWTSHGVHLIAIDSVWLVSIVASFSLSFLIWENGTSLPLGLLEGIKDAKSVMC